MEIPNFIGRPLVEVQAELASLGLVVNQVTEQYSVIHGDRFWTNSHRRECGPVGTPVNFVVSGSPARNTRDDAYSEEIKNF